MQETNWYIEYDNRTFSILYKPKFDKHIFRAAELFVNYPPAVSTQEQDIPEWVSSVAHAVKEISLLLYNFFYVEEKLTNNDLIKVTFLQIYTVLWVENLYSGFFFSCSENFRLNRVLACCIRVNRFLEEIYKNINNIRSSLDNTFLENLDEVYIFMQQKIKETLRKTEHLGNHNLNVILLDMLSLLLRNFGDPTMEKILDKAKERKLIELIEKENQVCQEFEENKIKEREENEQFSDIVVVMDFEEDPNLKKTVVVQEENDD